MSLILDNLAKYYFKTNQGQQSIGLFLESLQLKEKCVGTSHSLYAIGLDQLAVSMTTDIIQKEKALELYHISLTIFEKLFGTNHSSVGIVYNNIGIPEIPLSE